MFGQQNNKPSLFGTSSNTSAFGQPNASFGSSTVTPFGASLQQTQPQPLFGATNTFGSGATGTGLFGTSQSSSLFGSSNSNVPTSGGFGQPSNTNAFASSTSLFGTNAQQNASLFGSRFGPSGTSPFGGAPTIGTAPMQAPVGTTVKFTPVTGTDSMMKNGVTASINTRHQCITCMKEYEMKSLEELRYEDYNANRKGPQNLFGATNPAGGLFGSSAAPQNTAFGATNTMFGQSKPSPFGQTSTTSTTTAGALFGSFNKPNTGSIFGNTGTAFPSLQPQAPQTNTLFGPSPQTSTSLSQPNFFSGNTSTAAVKPFSFGSGTTQPQSLFGTNTAVNGLANKSMFSANTGNTTFGTSNTFNTPNTGTLFSTSQPSFFNTGPTSNTNQTPKPSLFNFSSQPTLNLNSTLGTNTNQTSQGLFGSNTFGPNAGSSLFNSSNTGSGSLFGQTSSLQAPSFQSNMGLQQLSSTNPTLNSDQLLTRFQTLPYGDSPLFHIDISGMNNEKNSMTAKTKFTTDPKTLYQYKMSAKSGDNKPQRIANNLNRATTVLFDGLEEEKFDDLTTAKDIFVPRKNVKKLVLKNKNISPENESLNPESSLNPYSFRNRCSFEESTVTLPHDTTIEFFNTKPKTIKDATITVLNKSPQNDLSHSSSKFSDSSHHESEDDIEVIVPKEFVRPKCGIILTRPDYYTLPTIEQIDSLYDASTDTCFIDSLTVGRHNYGSIFWDGPFDVKGLNLDEIVHIRRKEVIVYPDDDAKPSLGEGLNRHAQITLHQVWPIDKTSHEVIKDLDRLRSMKYAERIEAATVKLDATFKEYRPDTGSWVFTVKHFSKYGITDDDDEEMDDATDQSDITHAKQFNGKDLSNVKDDKQMSGKSLKLSESGKSIYDQSLRGDKLYDSLKPPSMISRELSEDIGEFNHQIFHDKEEDDLENIDDEESYSYEYLSQINEKLCDKYTMRSVLFDDEIEDDGDELNNRNFKKQKFSPLMYMNEKIAPSHFFSPIIPQPLKLSVPKKRILTVKSDTFTAQNKIIVDVNSIRLSHSPKIRFFKGSRNFTIISNSNVFICDLKLIDTNASMFNERFEEQLKKNSLITCSSRPNITLPPYIETRQFTRNSQNPKILEDFIEAFYGNLTEVSSYARHHERLSRIQRWLFKCNKKLSLPENSDDKIVHFLSTNELEAAANEALNSGQPRMACLISCGININKDLIIAQLDSWKKSEADEHIDVNVLKIYILLSGQIKWRLSTGKEINILQGLIWTQQLSLMLLYSSPLETYYEEMGVNILTAFLSQLTAPLPNHVEYHLMAQSHNPWIAMASADDILESWFLHESLKCYEGLVDDDEFSTKSDIIHCCLASQLQDIRWACFVALHIKNNLIREWIIKDILTRNAKILDENEEISQWLTKNLLIINEYIAEAKAIKAKVCFDHPKRALNLLECGQWSESHDVFVEHVFPELVIKEQRDLLSELLLKLKPHSGQIPQWLNGGHIYDSYLQFIANAQFEDFESFKIHLMKCNTKRHVLCRSEMTRKANDIYYSLSGGTFPYRTPIPDDYALMELKINAKNLAKVLF